MVAADRFQELAGVVDHQRARQPLQHLLALGQQTAVELELDVPAEFVDPRGHALQDLPGQHAALQHVEAHAARAGGGHGLELAVGRLLVDHDDGAGDVAQLGEAV